MAHLMAEMKAEIRTNQATADANLMEMKEGMTTRLEAKVEANNEKFESFEVLFCPGWISTQPGREPFKK
jgi:hypothetical protein